MYLFSKNLTNRQATVCIQHNLCFCAFYSKSYTISIYFKHQNQLRPMSGLSQTGGSGFGPSRLVYRCCNNFLRISQTKWRIIFFCSYFLDYTFYRGLRIKYLACKKPQKCFMLVPENFAPDPQHKFSISFNNE